MSIKIDTKSLVRANYDEHAEYYADRSDMQASNLERLLDLAEPSLRALTSSSLRWLDAGCGLGVAVEHLRRRRFDIAHYSGIDLSSQMIEIARRRFGAEGISFAAEDVEALPFPDQSFDIVLSNSMLHWLNQPAAGSTADKAFVELHRVLSRGGVFAVSVSGLGTGGTFNHAYQAALAQSGVRMDASVIADPVGSMALHDVVDMTANAGFDILLAHMEYEPVDFDSAASYAEAVRAYGYEMFTAHAPSGSREDLWKRIRDGFVAAVGPGVYRHDQYMNYIIARRR